MPTAAINYDIVDSDGEHFPVQVYMFLSNLDTLSDVFTNQVERLWDLIWPLVTGILDGVTLTVDFNDNIGDMNNNVVDILSDVQEKARLIFNVSDGVKTVFRMTIPTIREVVFTNSGAGKVLDLTDVDVQAFLTAMSTSVVGGGVNGVDMHSFGITSLKSGYQWFGKG